jgi:hypothetical protein
VRIHQAIGSAIGATTLIFGASGLAFASSNLPPNPPSDGAHAYNICYDKGSGDCLQAGFGASSAIVTTPGGGQGNQIWTNFKSSDFGGKCNTVTATCPFTRKSLDTRFHGDPVVKVAESNSGCITWAGGTSLILGDEANGWNCSDSGQEFVESGYSLVSVGYSDNQNAAKYIVTDGIPGDAIRLGAWVSGNAQWGWLFSS